MKNEKVVYRRREDRLPKRTESKMTSAGKLCFLISLLLFLLFLVHSYEEWSVRSVLIYDAP